MIAGVELSHDTYSNQSFTSTEQGCRRTRSRSCRSSIRRTRPAPATTKTVATNLAESSANGIGVYVNDTVSIGEHWKLIGGVRWDRYEASIHNSINVPSYATQTNFYTSVRGGVIFQPTETQSYYVSYGTSFNPSLEALTLTTRQQNLPPETNHSYEVGGKWDLLGGGLSITQSLFNIEKDNARTQTSTGVYTLDGDVRVRGYELGIAGHITTKWQVFGGYTYMDGKVVKALDGTTGNTLGEHAAQHGDAVDHLRAHAAVGNRRWADVHVVALCGEYQLRVGRRATRAGMRWSPITRQSTTSSSTC